MNRAETFNLLVELTKKELRLRYRRSSLGLGWSLLHPILMMGVFTLIFSRFPRLSGGDVPYYAFFLTGYLPWNYFATAIQNGQESVIANASIVKQMPFSRWTLPAATVLANAFHFGVAAGLWLLFLALHPGFDLPASAVAWPLLAILQTAFIFGLTLFLSAATVFFRDLAQLLSVLMTFLFYLTPVFYSLELFGQEDRWIGSVLQLNPMAHFVMLHRSLLLGQGEAGFVSWIYLAGWTAALLVVGLRFFMARSAVFAKEL
jgi:homopolymeric O-antigen transport system permease protein